jgi:hypothetical protein
VTSCTARGLHPDGPRVTISAPLRQIRRQGGGVRSKRRVVGLHTGLRPASGRRRRELLFLQRPSVWEWNPPWGASRVLTAAISSHLIHIAYSSVPGNPSASISCSVGQDSEPLIGTTGPTSTCLAGPPTHLSTPSHSPFLATVTQRVPLGPQKISLITLCVSAHVECSGQAPSPRSGRLAPGYPGYCRQG